MLNWPDLFCFLFGLLTAEGNSGWPGRPLPVPFLSRQLSESLPLPTPSRLLDRDKDSGDPWERNNMVYMVKQMQSSITYTWYQEMPKSEALSVPMSDLEGGAHAGLVWNMIGSPQLLDGLSWHGLWEAQTTPSVGRGPHLSHHRLL